MRIAFIDQSSQMGGVEYTTLRVAQAIDKSEYSPVIICPEEGALPKLASRAGIEVHIVPIPKFHSVSFEWKNRYIANPFGFILTAINILIASRRIEENLRTFPTDIVVTKGLLAHFYAGIAAKRIKVPCIWYLQEEVDSKRAGGFFQFLLNIFAKHLPVKIIVDAKALVTQLNCKNNCKGFIKVINNGVDTEEFVPFNDAEKSKAKKELRIPEERLVIGQAGRIVALKGQDVLLDAFSQIAKAYPDTHLLFVGAPLFGNLDFERRLKKQVDHHGLSDRVTFTGFLPDVRQGLAAMDVFVQASIETDSPISIMEAMSCGLPVIVSKVNGTEEMVEQSEDGLLFDPGDSQALAGKLELLINSSKQRRLFGYAARQSVIRNYSLETSVAKLQDLLEEVYAN